MSHESKIMIGMRTGIDMYSGYLPRLTKGCDGDEYLEGRFIFKAVFNFQRH
jgi:hypothetical protein